MQWIKSIDSHQIFYSHLFILSIVEPQFSKINSLHYPFLSHVSPRLSKLILCLPYCSGNQGSTVHNVLTFLKVISSLLLHVLQETTGPVNLDEFTSASQLESLGLDSLKSELMSRGLKCGGTLQQRAERLWAVKGKTKDEIDPSFFAKPSRLKKK